MYALLAIYTFLPWRLKRPSLWRRFFTVHSHDPTTLCSPFASLDTRCHLSTRMTIPPRRHQRPPNAQGTAAALPAPGAHESVRAQRPRWGHRITTGCLAFPARTRPRRDLVLEPRPRSHGVHISLQVRLYVCYPSHQQWQGAVTECRAAPNIMPLHCTFSLSS